MAVQPNCAPSTPIKRLLSLPNTSSNSCRTSEARAAYFQALSTLAAEGERELPSTAPSTGPVAPPARTPYDLENELARLREGAYRTEVIADNFNLMLLSGGSRGGGGFDDGPRSSRPPQQGGGAPSQEEGMGVEEDDVPF